VRLDGGEVGIVYQVNPAAPRQPGVLVVRDAAGEPIEAPRRIDLAADDPSPAIVEVLDAEAAGVDPFDYL
jgi:hypothetical protein